MKHKLLVQMYVWKNTPQEYSNRIFNNTAADTDC